MRVAAIYDIHGNLPALEAVVHDIRGEGVDQVVVGGDIVPGPMPSECVSLLMGLNLPVHFIVGNGENDVLSLDRGDGLTRVPAQFHSVVHWVHDELPPPHLQAFGEWPRTCTLEIPGLGKVLFCHATPRDDNELFTELTPVESLRPIFEATEAAVVVCGHTHMQFDRPVGRVRVTNAGSVGMPFGDPGAYWAILGPDVELRSTPYDLSAAAARIEATAYPQLASFDVRHPPGAAEMLAVFEAAALR